MVHHLLINIMDRGILWRLDGVFTKSDSSVLGERGVGELRGGCVPRHYEITMSWSKSLRIHSFAIMILRVEKISRGHAWT